MILVVVLVEAKVFKILIMLLLLSTFGRCCTLVVITDTTLLLAVATMQDRTFVQKKKRYTMQSQYMYSNSLPRSS